MKPTQWKRSTSTMSSSLSSFSSCSTLSTHTTRKRTPEKKYDKKKGTSKSYHRIKMGLKKSVPAAIVLWAFHKIPSKQGLTSRRVITFLKKHYRVIDYPSKTDESIGSILRCAVEFGLLEKHGNKFFLAKKKNRS